MTVSATSSATYDGNNLSTRYVDRFPDGKSPISLAFLDDDSNANYTFYKEYPKQRLDVPLPEINEDDIFIYGSYYSLNPALRGRMVEFLDYARQRKAILTTIRISARRTPTKHTPRPDITRKFRICRYRTWLGRRLPQYFRRD